MKRAPSPGLLWTAMLPPWASTILLEMARPMPVLLSSPAGRVLPRAKALKTRPFFVAEALAPS